MLVGPPVTLCYICVCRGGHILQHFGIPLLPLGF